MSHLQGIIIIVFSSQKYVYNQVLVSICKVFTNFRDHGFRMVSESETAFSSLDRRGIDSSKSVGNFMISGILESRIRESRNPEIQGPMVLGIHGSRDPGIQESWNPGILESWKKKGECFAPISVRHRTAADRLTEFLKFGRLPLHISKFGCTFVLCTHILY